HTPGFRPRRGLVVPRSRALGKSRHGVGYRPRRRRESACGEWLSPSGSSSTWRTSSRPLASKPYGAPPPLSVWAPEQLDQVSSMERSRGTGGITRPAPDPRSEPEELRCRPSDTHRDRPFRRRAARGPGDLLPEYGNVPRRLDTQPDLVAVDLHHRHHDVPIDHDLLIDFAAQDQHQDLLDSLARRST